MVSLRGISGITILTALMSVLFSTDKFDYQTVQCLIGLSLNSRLPVWCVPFHLSQDYEFLSFYIFSRKC